MHTSSGRSKGRAGPSPTAAGGRRWSTPGGELSFVLPQGWSATSQAAADGIAAQILPPGGTEQCALLIGSLTAQEQGQPAELLIRLGLQGIAQTVPHLSAGPLEPLSIGEHLAAQACLFSGTHPISGQSVRLWAAVGVENGSYVKVLFSAVDTPAFAPRLAAVRQLLASLQFPKPSPEAAAALVGTWRCQYEGSYGVYVDVFAFAPDGRYRFSEGGDFYFGGSGGGTGWKAGAGGFGGESSTAGTYEVTGNTLVLRDPARETLRIRS